MVVVGMMKPLTGSWRDGAEDELEDEELAAVDACGAIPPTPSAGMALKAQPSGSNDRPWQLVSLWL